MPRRGVSSQPKATTKSAERRATCCAPHPLAFSLRKASNALVAARGSGSVCPMWLSALMRVSSLSTTHPSGAAVPRSMKANVSRPPLDESGSFAAAIQLAAAIEFAAAIELAAAVELAAAIELAAAVTEYLATSDTSYGTLPSEAEAAAASDGAAGLVYGSFGLRSTA